MVLAETVEAVNASLNLTLTVVFVATPVAPLAGVTCDTTGGVVSAAVVNVELKSAARALPIWSLTTAAAVPPLTTTEKMVEAANFALGVSVAEKVLAS